MVLESHPLDLMEWQWFSMVFNGFGEPSIGLDEMSTVFNGSQPLAKQSIVFNGFNGWKATIGVNGIAMVFAETTIGLNGIGMVFIAAIDNEPSARFSDHTSPQ